MYVKDNPVAYRDPTGHNFLSDAWSKVKNAFEGSGGSWDGDGGSYGGGGANSNWGEGSGGGLGSGCGPKPVAQGTNLNTVSDNLMPPKDYAQARGLTNNEGNIIHNVFGDKINTSKMRIVRMAESVNNLISGGITLGNTIYLTSDNFDNNGNIKEKRRGLFVHEATHVYQSQNRSHKFNYLNNAVECLINNGTKDSFYGTYDPYDLKNNIRKDGTSGSWQDMTVEEQADAMQEYYQRSYQNKFGDKYTSISKNTLRKWHNQMLQEKTNVANSNSLQRHWFWEKNDRIIRNHFNPEER